MEDGGVNRLVSKLPETLGVKVVAVVKRHRDARKGGLASVPELPTIWRRHRAPLIKSMLIALEIS